MAGLAVLLPRYIGNNTMPMLGQIVALVLLLSLVLVTAWKTKDPKHATKYKELAEKRAAVQAVTDKSINPSIEESSE